MISVAETTHHEKFLQPPEFSPVKWLDGVTEDDSAPRYLMPTQRRRGQLDNASFSTLVVRIGDLGGGNFCISLSCEPTTAHM